MKANVPNEKPLLKTTTMSEDSFYFREETGKNQTTTADGHQQFQNIFSNFLATFLFIWIFRSQDETLLLITRPYVYSSSIGLRKTIQTKVLLYTELFI